MTSPISVGIGGYSGWLVLQRREERQMELLSRDPIVQRNTSHFRDRIEVISSAEELVGDYRTLTVALGAFGLEQEIGNRAFIKKVLESDLDDNRSFANRLADKRYLKLAQAFGFHASKADRNQAAVAGSGILENTPWMVGLTKQKRDFAQEVAGRLERFGQRDSANEAIWLAVNSDPKIARVFTGALRLDDDHFQLPPDQQFANFKKKIFSKYGTDDLNKIIRPELIEKVVVDFFIKDGSTFLTDKEARRAFEFRVGAIHHDKDTQAFLRDVRHDLQVLSTTGSDNPEQWLKAQENPALKKFFAGVFNFGDDLRKLSPGEQIQKYTEASDWLLGSPLLSGLSAPETEERLFQTYLFNRSKSIKDAAPDLGFSSDTVFDFAAGLLDQGDDIRELAFEAREAIGSQLYDLVEGNDFIRKVVEGGLQVVGDYSSEVGRKATRKKLDTAAERLLGTSFAAGIADTAAFGRVVQSYLFHTRRQSTEPITSSGSDLADRISSAYLEREFERRVGLSDETLRLALNARRALTEFASRDASDKTLWYEVLGNQPLRKVFEGALGFGPDYGKLDVDRQVDEFEYAAGKLFGSSAFSEIAKPENIDRLIRTYLIRSQITLSGTSDRYSTALTLLSQ